MSSSKYKHKKWNLYKELMPVLLKRNYIIIYTVEIKGKYIKNIAIKNVLICVCDTSMSDTHVSRLGK